MHYVQYIFTESLLFAILDVDKSLYPLYIVCLCPHQFFCIDKLEVAALMVKRNVG